MLQNLCWEELIQRRMQAQVLILYKISNALVCIPATQLITGRYNTRSRARGGYRQIEATTVQLFPDGYTRLEYPATSYYHYPISRRV